MVAGQAERVLDQRILSSSTKHCWPRPTHKWAVWYVELYCTAFHGLLCCPRRGRPQAARSAWVTLYPLPCPACLLIVLTRGLLVGCRPGAGGPGQPDNHAARRDAEHREAAGEDDDGEVRTSSAEGALHGHGHHLRRHTGVLLSELVSNSRRLAVEQSHKCACWGSLSGREPAVDCTLG